MMMDHDANIEALLDGSRVHLAHDSKLNYSPVGYLEAPLLLSPSSHITFDQSSDFTAWWWPTVDNSEVSVRLEATLD
jgi:hypothetical protein